MNNQVFEEVINKLILFFFFFLPLIQPLISTVVSLYKTVFNIQGFFYALQALAHTSNCLLKLST